MPALRKGLIWGKYRRSRGWELSGQIFASSPPKLLRGAFGPKPRFLTAGPGAVWTLNQGDGSLSRIDTAGHRPVAAVPLNTPGAGGDIAYSGGVVWSTVIGAPLTAVDAARAVILCQWKRAGGDAIGVGHGAVWLTDPTGGKVLRIDLSDVSKECRGGD